MDLLTLCLEKVDILPPTRVTDDTSVLTIKNLVFEPLLRWDRGFVRSALFSHWTHSPDGRSWRFFLRDGATFHDGEPCRAQDVLAVLDGILEAVDTFGMKWSYARYLANARMTAEGDGVLRVETPAPFADLLDLFSEFYISRFDASGRPVLGTGRYRVGELEPGRRIVLEKTPGAAGPERIVAIAETRAEARYDRLREGTVDAALNLERVEGALVREEAFVWGQAVNTLSVMAYLNAGQGLFRSASARLAVNHAVDKAALVAEVFDGLAVPSATIVSPFHLGAAKANLSPIPYDPDMARRLLDTVGGCGRIVLRTPTFMPDRAPRTSRFIAAALQAVGLDVVIETEPDRPDYARQIGRKEMGDMALFDSSPHSTYRILDDKISSRTRAVWWQGHDDPDIETLIATAHRQISDGDRERAYAHCLQRLHRNPPWLYLVHPIDVFAARRGVGGLSIDHKGTLDIR